MRMTIFRADCSGNAGNCVYPKKVEIDSADALKAAAAYDHVCGEFKKNYRSNDNFIRSDTIVMDLDNDHSDNPDDWITEEKLDELMPDISYALVPSRHHMKAKDGAAPRPKYHVYFPIKETTDKDTYAAIKRGIHKAYPFFDGNALDAARFVYGSSTGDVVWHEGWVNIDEDIEPETEAGEGAGGSTTRGSIPAGSRNNTLSRFAGRVVKRYGATEKAHDIFMEEAARCDPPLEESELDSIWGSATRFYKKLQSQGGYVAPDKYNDDFARQSLKPSDYSDIGQAKVLMREYGDELVYTDATEYMRYDGTRWVESRQLAVGACEEFLDLQLQDALDVLGAAKEALINSGVAEKVVTSGGKALEKAVDGDEQLKLLAAYLAARQYMAFVMKRRDMKYITSALQAGKPMVLKDIKDFDSQPFLLNTPAATYDMTIGLDGAREHSAEDFITKSTSVSVSDEGKDLWLDSINGFFCGDADLIDYVQKIVGLAAIGKVYVEALIISYGEGSNGKSTFWNTISRVLGSYSGSLSADALTVGCRRNVKPEMAELKGKRLVIAAELEEGMRLNTATVKQLCATDEIGAEKKYKDPFKYIPTHTLVLYTNHLPKVGASDEGTWRRLIVIPFNAKIKGKKDIKNYADFLVENAGGAVLSWIIEGAKKAIDEDFHIKPPKCVQDAIDRYHESNDWLSLFLDECCETDPSYTQKSGEFYMEYRNYCQRTGEYTRSTTDFYAAVEAAGFVKRKSRTGAMIHGLRLKSDFLDD